MGRDQIKLGSRAMLRFYFLYTAETHWDILSKKSHPNIYILKVHIFPLHTDCGWKFWCHLQGQESMISRICLTSCYEEKAMATHSSVLSWRIPGMEEPGGLPSMQSHRVGHNWSDLAAADIQIVSIYFSVTNKASVSACIIWYCVHLRIFLILLWGELLN